MYEALKAFETDLNTEAKTGNLKVHVVIVPMSRDQLYPALASGKVDMVAAMVTVRPRAGGPRGVLRADAHERQPGRGNGTGAPPIATVDDLAGQEVFVRKASAYYESLIRLNEQLKARGKPAIVIDEASRCPGRRRRARDGQRRPRADHRRGRLSRRFLEPGLHRHYGASGHHSAFRRQSRGRVSKGQSTASGRRLPLS